VNVREVIAKKRDGRELTAEEIGWVVAGFTSGAIGEGPMAALLMAIVLRGMTERETADLTQAMVASGKQLDLSGIPGIKVDKHSTGGVGDKTTLVVAPLAASFGVRVPKMSGRALGHTGGTIDKLECIPGLRTDLSPEQFRQQVSEIGLAIAAQTAALAPADKKIYALRDATATVESTPLIASSVMSKKLAAGGDAIVLDVKAGRGAFMPDVRAAEELARAMLDSGARAGRRVIALVTRMDQPLGRAVGDALELTEAIETLKGNGPDDFVELCEVVAGYMLVAGGSAADTSEGHRLARQGLADGRGLAKLREMVGRQGGDAAVLDRPEILLEGATRAPVVLEGEGIVVELGARRVGTAVRRLKSAAASGKASCGVALEKKVGDDVMAGEPVATVLAPPGLEGAVAEAADEIAAAFRLSDSYEGEPELVAAVLDSTGGTDGA